MRAPVLHLDGKDYVVVPRDEYERLTAGTSAVSLPPMPKPDAAGNVPAVSYARASIARELLTRMQRAGLTQAELARRAKVPAETLNRILRCKRTPDEATILKLEKVLG